ncbi:MAG: zinc-binding dehydrogenase [Alphaproteobacteria bacterium]|nr:zinc-binding dehydrogenase [Alphaproteobacteria bacterium]
MKAIIAADNMPSLVDRPAPAPAKGEILLKVLASGINRADLLQCKGKYNPPEGASDILGLEVSGEVIETAGPWNKGDILCALLPGGGYAEYVTVPASLCLSVPPSINPVEAAGLPEALFTVYKNIFKIGRFQKDETVFIQGGASGIGTMAIQMVKAMGGRVVVTAGSDERCKQCLALGADEAINYKTQDFTDIKADIILDMVGGDYLPKHIAMLNNRGRHISIAYMGGAKAEALIPAIMQKELTITGSTLRNSPLPEKEMLAREIYKSVGPLLENGTIKPVIGGIFPMTEARKAHESLEKGEIFGKSLLTP